MERITKQDCDNDFCLECCEHGEPNGCNRPEGVCDAYNFFQEVWQKLAAYEDAEEQGRLVVTPDCKKCVNKGHGECIFSNCIGKFAWTGEDATDICNNFKAAENALKEG